MTQSVGGDVVAEEAVALLEAHGRLSILWPDGGREEITWHSYSESWRAEAQAEIDEAGWSVTGGWTRVNYVDWQVSIIRQ